MNHRGRWRIGALASAVALLGSLASLEVHALALGRITVQSALGEPLRGEIEITQINPEEAASLKVGIASPEMFKAAGLEYPAAAAGLEVKLQRRADGRPYLHLNSNRAVTEPFVDLILEASSASGRVTRDYTMLFDPPSLRAAGSTAAPVPTAPILPRAAAIQPARAVTPSPTDTTPPAEKPPGPAPKAAEAKTEPAEKAPGSENRVTVKRGDNASKIAAQHKPDNVSLDQMLVALLRSNPGAFIGGNINVIKSGAVLEIPSAEAVSAISPTKAARIVVAQSRDFNAFRRKLAESAATTQAANADRQAGGTLQAKVEDQALPSAAPDKLTLSKGAVQGKPAGTPEDKIARDKQAKDNSARMAELSKNIDDLNKLAPVPSAAAPAGKPASAPVPGIKVATPASLATSAPVQPAVQASSSAVTAASAPLAAPVAAALPAASAASAATTADAAAAPASAASSAPDPLASASEPALAASASAAVASAPIVIKKPVVQPPPPPPEPELLDQLLEDPLPLLGGVGLLALLGGGAYAFTRYRRQKKSKTAPVDSSFLESRLQPDSFFGASGGSRVNTNGGENNITGSSMAYTPSQMDASGDVDPVAEADVYLAYGRDEQAEEILKEALHTYPTRVAIHAKLLEIYAKRRDNKTFENLAGEAFKLTQGHGPEWAFIVELGAELDPGNPLYNAGGTGSGKAAQEAVAAPEPSSAEAPAHWQPEPAAAPAPAPMDMEFSSPAASPTPLPTAPAPQMPSPATATPPASTLDELDLGLDFDLEPPPSPAAKPAAAPPAPPPQIEPLAQGLNFTPEPFVPAKPAPKPAPAPAPASAPATADAGMMEFDLDSFSLDFPAPVETQSPAETADAEDPLEVKFLLAEEFRSLGDTDGARSLADEVLAKAKGPLKVKVQAFLNTLS